MGLNMKIKTTHDGWGCVPELTEVTYELDQIGDYVYEIKNCVRISDLESMVQDLSEIMDNVKYHLDKINVQTEFITVDIED